jgi:hypothetical protein
MRSSQIFKSLLGQSIAFFFQGFRRVTDDTKWLAFQQLVQACGFGWSVSAEQGGTIVVLGGSCDVIQFDHCNAD